MLLKENVEMKWIFQLYTFLYTYLGSYQLEAFYRSLMVMFELGK